MPVLPSARLALVGSEFVEGIGKLVVGEVGQLVAHLADV